MSILSARASAFAAAVLSVAGTLAAPSANADSAVWVLRGKQNSIYLAGSVHALPANDSKLPATIEKAYGEAEQLVMELDLDDLNEAEATQFMMERGTLPEGQSLRSVIGDKRFEQLTKITTKLGLPMAAIDRLEPWSVGLLVTQLALMQTGYDGKLGVDQQLATRAKTDGKAITGLETITEQLNVFDRQSYAEQARFLEMSTLDAETVRRELAEMIGAWRTANLDVLDRELREEFRDAPKLYEALLVERNKNWIPKILALQNSKDDYLVVVGALHLVGTDGVIKLLEKRGVKLERLH
jgi:uncharacterized protein